MTGNRAAILPYPGDPYLFRFWLRFYDKYWRKQIDRLYVHLNSPVEQCVVDYVANLCDERDITLLITHNYTDHGNAINQLLDIVQEKWVMLIEDDAFIFNDEIVNGAFSLLENGHFDIVGGKRGSCATEILEAAQQKWGISYTGEGDQGPNFWPCYFFSSVDLLKSTDRNFNARAWHKGEKLPGLDCDVEADVLYGDTFVNTSLQLRGLVPSHRIAYLPQYHAHPDDLLHAERNQYLFDGRAPWTHIGSLSSGMSGLLRDIEHRPLANRSHIDPQTPEPLPNAPKSEMERKEYERRVQIWLTAWQTSEVTPETADFHAAYGHALERVIVEFGLSRGDIRQRQSVYQKRLFKL